MKLCKISRVHLLLVSACFFSLIQLYGETIRDRANQRFTMIDWATDPDIIPPVEKAGSIVVGGNETFPLLEMGSGTGLPAVYPEVERLGKIEYSGIDPTAVSLLRSIGEFIKDRKIEALNCNPDRPFLSVLANFQLQKLPVPNAVLFSHPTPVSEGSILVIFRLQFKHEKISDFVYVSVTLDRIHEKWLINQIQFDGETYANLAQSN